MDDARLNVSLALTAIYHGACVLNYVKVEELIKGPEGRIVGARLRDQLTGREYKIDSSVTL